MDDNLHATIETHEVIEVLQLVIKLSHMVIGLYDRIDELTGVRYAGRLTIDDLTAAIVGDSSTTWMEGGELHMRKPFQVMGRIRRMFLLNGGHESAVPAAPEVVVVDEDGGEAPLPEPFEDVRDGIDEEAAVGVAADLAAEAMGVEGNEMERQEDVFSTKPDGAMAIDADEPDEIPQLYDAPLLFENDTNLLCRRHGADISLGESRYLNSACADAGRKDPTPSPHVVAIEKEWLVPDRVENTIQQLQGMLATTPAGVEFDPHRLARLRNLSSLYTARYERTHDLKDLHQTISFRKQLLDVTPTDDVFLLPRTAVLIEQLSELYECTGDIGSLTQGIAYTEAAVAGLPPGHHARVHWLLQLATRLDLKYCHSGVIADLNGSISHLQEVLQSTPETSPGRSSYLTVMSSRMRRLYEYGGAPENIRAAVSYAVDAVVTTPIQHEQRASHVRDLLSLLDLRYTDSGTSEDLVEAILYYGEKMTGMSDNDPFKIQVLDGLSRHLCGRYARTGTVDDVDKAILFTREALATVPDHFVRAQLTHDLARTLGLGYHNMAQAPGLDGPPLKSLIGDVILESLAVVFYQAGGDGTQTTSRIIPSRDACVSMPARFCEPLPQYVHCTCSNPCGGFGEQLHRERSGVLGTR